MYHRHRFGLISLSFFRLNSFDIFFSSESMQTCVKHTCTKKTANADDLLQRATSHRFAFTQFGRGVPTRFHSKMLCATHIYSGFKQKPNHHTIRLCSVVCVYDVLIGEKKKKKKWWQKQQASICSQKQRFPIEFEHVVEIRELIT